MAKEPENLVLEHQRALLGDVSHVKDAVDRIELRPASVATHIAAFQLSDTRQNSKLDKLRQRRDRIGRRLELVGPK